MYKGKKVIVMMYISKLKFFSYALGILLVSTINTQAQGQSPSLTYVGDVIPHLTGILECNTPVQHIQILKSRSPREAISKIQQFMLQKNIRKSGCMPISPPNTISVLILNIVEVIPNALTPSGRETMTVFQYIRLMGTQYEDGSTDEPWQLQKNSDGSIPVFYGATKNRILPRLRGVRKAYYAE